MSKRLILNLDPQAAKALEAMSEQDRRPLAWEAEVLLRKALGLPAVERPRFLYSAGRLVGAIERGILTKRVKIANQLRVPPAWALDVDHIEALRDAGGSTVLLTDDSGEVWSATLEDFDRKAITLNRGFGRQLALPLAHWRVGRREVD